MHQDAVKLIKLMFRPEESICVSPNKYGYHSIPVANVMDGILTLVPPSKSDDYSIEKWRGRFEYVPSNEMKLVALNPIKGFRQDANCTAYRNFLIEIDVGTQEQQLDYINRLRLPFSAIVFSGNKSLHFLISLEQDLPDEESYRFFSEWILSVVTLADQNTKNPSRSIRLPGAIRETGRQQSLITFLGPVKLSDLTEWLEQHPDAKPKRRKTHCISENPCPERLSAWVIRQLTGGIDFSKGRNKTWFSFACEFAKAGYSEDDALVFLSNYFCSERDFTEREWRSAIKSAFKYVYKRGP